MRRQFIGRLADKLGQRHDRQRQNEKQDQRRPTQKMRDASL